MATTQVYKLASGLWTSPGRSSISTLGAYGTYKPDTPGTNVALNLSPTSTVTTATTFSTAGQTINDTTFNNWVTVNNTQNVTFNRCVFRGAPAGDTNLATRIVEVKGASASNIVFNDCKFEAYDHTIQGFATGLGGHDFTANRCWFVGAIDSVDIYSFDGPNANVGLYGCLMDACDCFYPATDGHTDGSHCDNVQITNGYYFIAVGNLMTGMLSTTTQSQGTPYYPQSNSAIQFNQSSGSLSVGHVLLDHNWFGGGNIAALNIADNSQGVITDLKITNNRFLRTGQTRTEVSPMTHDQENWDVTMFSAETTYSDPSFVFTGNVLDSDGVTPAVIHH